jgi:hypothetical protein
MTMPKSNRNGDRARQPLGYFCFGLELRFQQEIGQMAPHAQRQALAWLRRKRRLPERVFWEILPTGGRRRL